MPKFELDSLTEYSDQAILGEIQRVAALHADGPLTKTTFVKLSPKVSWSTVQKRFGGWRKALLAAGLTHLSVEYHMPYREKMHPGTGMSDGELVNEMLRVNSVLGGDALTAKGFDRVSVTHSDLIRKRFGDWKSALTKAGIAQSESGKRYTDEQCFENLAAVWTHYGRPPQHDAMKNPPSIVGAKAYVLRWERGARV